MADQKSFATTSTDAVSLEKPVSTSSSATTTTTTSIPSKRCQPSCRDELHLSSRKPEEPGKETWRDASLSDEQRWKEWNKAKDREQKRNVLTAMQRRDRCIYTVL
ncbi:hypothetical protein DPSP01_013363 [Paraphaeosphaeria sporulosa]